MLKYEPFLSSSNQLEVGRWKRSLSAGFESGRRESEFFGRLLGILLRRHIVYYENEFFNTPADFLIRLLLDAM